MINKKKKGDVFLCVFNKRNAIRERPREINCYGTKALSNEELLAIAQNGLS